MSISQYAILFEQYRSKHPFTGTPENLYAPMQYIMDIGGKRARPILVLSSCASSNGNPADALPVAHALEVFHNFTLIHDDILDQSPIRRGKATVHEKWGLATAILSGDNLLVAAYEELIKYKCPGQELMLKIFNRTATEVCAGQQLDMDFAKNNHVQESEYLEMIRLKTAVLLGCCAYCGSICAGQDHATALKYYDFAINLGLAFQLNDDWLDTFGDPAKTGKKVGGDISQCKMNWLSIASRQSGFDSVRAYQENPTESGIQHIIQQYKNAGLDVKLKELAAMYHDRVENSLADLKGNGHQTIHLEELADMLFNRDR